MEPELEKDDMTACSGECVTEKLEVLTAHPLLSYQCIDCVLHAGTATGLLLSPESGTGS